MKGRRRVNIVCAWIMIMILVFILFFFVRYISCKHYWFQWEIFFLPFSCFSFRISELLEFISFCLILLSSLFAVCYIFIKRKIKYEWWNSKLVKNLSFTSIVEETAVHSVSWNYQAVSYYCFNSYFFFFFVLSKLCWIVPTSAFNNNVTWGRQTNCYIH